MLWRSKAALMDELAGLRVQHTAALAELAAERMRADKAEIRADKAEGWLVAWKLADQGEFAQRASANERDLPKWA